MRQFIILWWLTVNSLDFFVTSYGLNAGTGYELNTVPSVIVSTTGLAGLFLWKAAWTYVGLYLIIRAKSTRVWFAAGALCVLLSIVVIWNLMQVHGV